MKLTILLAGVSLLASEALAGNVSNVSGTLDTTMVDPAPALYPHFICASGCSSGAVNAVTQSGNWNIGISNFPATQTVNGSVSVAGVASSANQPALNFDGGALSHITNLPAIQPVSGSISVSNLPTNQAVSGTVSIGNFPATQAITGSITVPGVATAASQPALNGDGGGLAHITNFPSLQAISGNVSVGNFPSVQSISGSVSISNLPTNQPVTGTVSVGNFPVSQTVTGSVSVGNFPATQTVTGSVTVPGVATAASQPGLHIDGGGLAHVTNWPASQPVSGSVSISNLPTTQAVSGSVSVGNFPVSQTVTGSVTVPGVATAASQPGLHTDGGGLAHVTNWPASQPVSGSVSISNLPTTQAVSGSVSVGNFPVSQTVTGSVTVPGVATAASQPGLHIDGGGLAHVTNWPASQLVSGSVSISNLPTTQAVSGSVSVGNFPSVQAVNGTLSIGASVGFGAAGSPSSSVGTVQGISNGTPVTVSLSDGSDAALGSKADLPSSSGSASVVSLLKQLHLDSLGSISTGSNVIGAVNLGAQTVFNTPIVSATLESSHVFKATAGQLTSAYVVATAAGYLMIFNNATAPSDGTVAPIECIPVAANVSTGISFAGLPPENYATGITAVFSSTGCFTKTASATAFFHGAVQ